MTLIPSEVSKYSNVVQLPQTNQLKTLLTIIRNKETNREDFVFYSDRIIRLLVEEALNHLSVLPNLITTPTGDQFQGSTFGGHICGVSIMRAGESMEKGLRDCCRSVRIGKILIQRDETTFLPELFYEKLPKDIEKRICLLLDPMLATGGSAIKAMDVLIEKGVPEKSIIFINLIATPVGIKAVHDKYPNIKIITSQIDPGLNGNKYIAPGLGDFGCRYFGTD